MEKAPMNGDGWAECEINADLDYQWGTRRTPSVDGSGGLTLDSLRTALEKFKRPPVVLVAVVLVVEEYAGDAFEVLPANIDVFQGWPLLEGIIGADGVRIVRETRSGGKVLIAGAAQFDDWVATFGLETGNVRPIFGIPVHRVTHG